MALDENKKIAALNRLRKSLDSDIREGKPPSDLILARVVDLCQSALPGDATKVVIDRLQKREGAEAAGEKDVEAAVELIDAAIQSLKSEAIDKAVQPGIAPYDPYFQGLVSHALFNNKWVKRSFVGLVLAYVLAVSLLLYPISKALDRAGQAGELLLAAEQNVLLTKNQLREANNLVLEVNGRMDGFRTDYARVQERIDALHTEINGIEGEIARRKGAFEQSVANIEATFRTNANKAVERIAELPGEAENRVTQTFEQAKKLAEVQLGAITELKKQTEDNDNIVKTLYRRLKAHESKLDETISEKVDALFVGRDQEITSLIDKKVSAATGPHLQRLTVWTNNEERSFNEEAEHLRQRRGTLGARLTKLDTAAAELERQRSEVEVKYGTFARLPQQIEQLEDRIRVLNKAIAPENQLVKALRDRTEPVAKLLGEAMAVSNEEIAGQLWLVIKTNYVIAGLALVAVVFLFWLFYLTFREPRTQH